MSDEQAKREKVPTLAMVHAAYVADDLDYMDLERLIEAALRGEKTEIPEPMLSLFFAPGWTDAMKEMGSTPRAFIPFTDAPGQVIGVRGDPRDAYPRTREERREYIRQRLAQ